MKTVLCFFLIILAISLNKAHAQLNSKKDTIYYLLDTSTAAKNSGMITSETSTPHRFVMIHCPCLNNNIEPTFRCNLTMQANITEAAFNKMRFINLAELITYVKKYDADDFDKHHVIYFVERIGKKITKRQVFFMGSKITVTY